MKYLELRRLGDILALHDGVNLPDNRVTSVHAAHSFDEIGKAHNGAIVVLDSTLSLELQSFQFDMALATVGSQPSAVVSTEAGAPEPTATAIRIAQNKNIALGVLSPRHDAVSLALRVRDLTRGGYEAEVSALEQTCALTDVCDSLDQIPGLLASISVEIMASLDIRDARVTEHDITVRVQGIVRSYLSFGDLMPSPTMKAAAAYAARKIETLLQTDYETREVPETTRSELLNEILLSEAATSANAAGRLRLADFPIDGSHYAIRVDCHDPLPRPTSVQATYRYQQRIAETMLESVRATGGHWTKAGTANSILLISSRATPHREPFASRATEPAAEAIDNAVSAIPELRLHVGVGTPHLGIAGIRSSVNEATTAVRTARDRNVVNKPLQFDRLGLSRALVRWAEIDGVRPVMDEILAPLLDQTPRRAQEALTTLRAYLDAGRNVSLAAATLHIHRNTVRYRMEQISAVLTVDLNDPDERLLLELSCRLASADVPYPSPTQSGAASH